MFQSLVWIKSEMVSNGFELELQLVRVWIGLEFDLDMAMVQFGIEIGYGFDYNQFGIGIRIGYGHGLVSNWNWILIWDGLEL